MANESSLERTFATLWRVVRGPEYVTQYRFHPTRKWLFDVAWPDLMIAVELDGGGAQHGRHHRDKGHSDDCEKANAATMMGWQVYRMTSLMLRDNPSLHLEPLVAHIAIQTAALKEPPPATDIGRPATTGRAFWAEWEHASSHNQPPAPEATDH